MQLELIRPNDLIPMIMTGGYSSLLGSSNRRLSYAGIRRKSTSIDTSRIFSGYPMGGSFGIDDYFIESDGDEADDEFDQITNSAEVEVHPNQFHLSVQPKVSSMSDIAIHSNVTNSISLTFCHFSRDKNRVVAVILHVAVARVRIWSVAVRQ